MQKKELILLIQTFLMKLLVLLLMKLKKQAFKIQFGCVHKKYSKKKKIQLNYLIISSLMI